MNKREAVPHGPEKTFPDSRFISGRARPFRPLRTWIMVVDDQNARIFTKENKTIEMVGKIISAKPHIKPVTNTINHKKKTIYYRYESLVKTEKDKGEPLTFAHKISAWLDEAIWNDSFDRMILITPVHMQPVLFNILSTPAQARIIDILNRDFSGLSSKAIQRELHQTITAP